MVYVCANKEAKKEFVIPVTWEVFSKVMVQANSLEEAMEYVEKNLDEIPIEYDDAEYVDGSYYVTANDIDEAMIYQKDQIVCTNYSCIPNLSDYTDSMLFDSSEPEAYIAKGTFVKGLETINISLEVAGDISITYKGKIYNHAKGYPEELITLIKTDKNWWDSGDVEVYSNNWYEYIIDGTESITKEDLDISRETIGSICDSMQAIAEQYFDKTVD